MGTVKEDTLRFLKEHPSQEFSVLSIAQQINAASNSVGVALARLREEGSVEHPGWGKYRLTQSSEKEIGGIPNLEDLNIIYKLREFYGKERLLIILEKIKKTIE